MSALTELKAKLTAIPTEELDKSIFPNFDQRRQVSVLSPDTSILNNAATALDDLIYYHSTFLLEEPLPSPSGLAGWYLALCCGDAVAELQTAQHYGFENRTVLVDKKINRSQAENPDLITYEQPLFDFLKTLELHAYLEGSCNLVTLLGIEYLLNEAPDGLYPFTKADALAVLLQPYLGPESYVLIYPGVGTQAPVWEALGYIFLQNRPDVSVAAYFQGHTPTQSKSEV